MENILYNDLIRRGFDVDAGVVEQNTRDEFGKNVRKQLEVDFVVNRGGMKKAFSILELRISFWMRAAFLNRCLQK
ncbi:MAG: hypothetical protein IJX90_12420 [Blautia sp.]|nr:hypothetical protein [Blautia sp.]